MLSCYAGLPVTTYWGHGEVVYVTEGDDDGHDGYLLDVVVVIGENTHVFKSIPTNALEKNIEWDDREFRMEDDAREQALILQQLDEEFGEMFAEEFDPTPPSVHELANEIYRRVLPPGVCCECYTFPCRCGRD